MIVSIDASKKRKKKKEENKKGKQWMKLLL